MITDYQLIVMFSFWFLLSGVNCYIAWFKPDLFRTYLYWNSQIFGVTHSGKKWMASKYYFWMMRIGATFLFILSLIGITVILIEIF